MAPQRRSVYGEGRLCAETSRTTTLTAWLAREFRVGWCMIFPVICARFWSPTTRRLRRGETSRRWPATNSSAGSKTPSRIRPGHDGFVEPEKSWKKDSDDPAAGRVAGIVNAPVSRSDERVKHDLADLLRAATSDSEFMGPRQGLFACGNFDDGEAADHRL